MKKIAIIFAVVIAVAVGVTDWIGASIEKRFPLFMQQAAEISQMQLTIDSYDRGLFRSSARTTITLQSLDREGVTIALQHTIWHGPFPFGADSLGNWHLQPAAALVETRLSADTADPGVVGMLLELLPELRELQNLTVIGFAGNGQTDISLPAFQRDFVTNEIKTSVDWGGLSGSETFDASLSNISGRFSMPGLSIIRPDFVVKANGIDANFRLSLAENGLLLGQVNLNAADIAAGERGAEPTFILKGFQFRNAARQDNDTVGYSIEIVADTLLAAGRKAGPIGCELDFTQLDTATLVAVQRQLQALQLDTNEASGEDVGERIIGIYAEALPALLQKSPKIDLNYLRIQSPDGDLWGKGSLIFAGDSATPITDFSSFTGIITGDSEFQISATLLQSILREILAPQLTMMRENGQMGEIDDIQFAASLDQAIAGQTASLVSQGILVEDNSNYRMQISYNNRQALLNGKPMAL